MYVLRNQADTRFGFTVSRKIGKAVVRNRVRRRLGEIVRRNMDKFPGGCWWVFNAKRLSATATSTVLEQDLIYAVDRYVEMVGAGTD